MQLVRGKKLISEQALALPLPPRAVPPALRRQKIRVAALLFRRRLYIWEKIGYNRTAR